MFKISWCPLHIWYWSIYLILTYLSIHPSIQLVVYCNFCFEYCTVMWRMSFDCCRFWMSKAWTVYWVNGRVFLHRFQCIFHQQVHCPSNRTNLCVPLVGIDADTCFSRWRSVTQQNLQNRKIVNNDNNNQDVPFSVILESLYKSKCYQMRFLSSIPLITRLLNVTLKRL